MTKYLMGKKFIASYLIAEWQTLWLVVGSHDDLKNLLGSLCPHLHGGPEYTQCDVW